jgi:hypothetical protein
MRYLVPIVLSSLSLAALAWSAAAQTSAPALMHRYLIARTFPPGALDGLDAAGKRQVNARNDAEGVRWVRSYANADKTRTFCVYEGPSEAAVWAAAARNSLPIDSIAEIPVDLDPGPLPAMPEPVHRYLVERTFPPHALDGLDAAGKATVNANNAALGVKWVGSYANAEKTKTYCVYRGPSEEAVRQAAAKNAIPVDSMIEVPVDLLPN